MKAAARREPGRPRERLLERLLERLFRPIELDGRSLPSIGVLVLAIVGASFLVVAATSFWFAPTDEAAYWRAGERLLAGAPLYDPTARPDLAWAYWYPPPMAQLLAPLTPFFSESLFTTAWTVLLLGCLWWLGGRNVLVALALIAFLPVAVEFRTRNAHLVIAVLLILGLRRSPLFWIPAAMLKISPGLGALYLIAARRYREAVLMVLVTLAVVAVSFVISPDAWRQFAEVVANRGGSSGGAFLPIPYPVRFAVGALLVAIGGWRNRAPSGAESGRVLGEAHASGEAGESPSSRVDRRVGEILFVVGVTIANPTLWVTALSLLVAIFPLMRRRPHPEPEPTVEVPGLLAAKA
jgi:hypothetical protein